MRSAARRVIVTGTRWRATATTSATESGEPSRTTADPPSGSGAGLTAAPLPELPDRSAGLRLVRLDHRNLARRVDVDGHRCAVLARLGVPPRSQQPGPGRVERHGKSPGFRGNFQAVVGLPVALERRRVDARLLGDPPEPHPLRVEEPDAVARIDAFHSDAPVLAHPVPRAPG